MLASPVGYVASNARATATDAAGNVYVVGDIQGDATFGAFASVGNPLASGSTDVVVAKLDAAGHYLWVVRAGGDGYDYGNDIAVSPAGDVYITGTFASVAIFGAFAVTTPMGLGSGAFVAKLTPAGNWQWVASASGGISNGANSYTDGRKLTLDSLGQVTLLGNFRGNATFGATTLTSPNPIVEGYVAQLSAAGTWQWVTSLGSRSFFQSLAATASGGFYVAGKYSSFSVTIGSTVLSNPVGAEAFVGKMSADGQWEWGISVPGLVSTNAIKAHATEAVYLAGSYEFVPAEFGNILLPNAGRKDLFVAKLSSDQTWLWATSLSSPDEEECYSLTLDAAGDAYLAGSFTGESFTVGSSTLVNHAIKTYAYENLVAKIDAAGNWQWGISAGGTQEDKALGLALDAQQHLYAVGQCGENSTFGTITLPNPEPRWFVARVGLPVLGTPSGAAEGVAGFSLAPNPAHEVVQVTAAKATSVVLRDLLGQTVREAAPTDGRAALSLVGLAPGVYLIQAGGQTQRLVVE